MIITCLHSFVRKPNGMHLCIAFYCNTTHAIAMNGQVAAALKLVQTHPDDLDDAFPDNFPTIYLSHCVQPGAKSRKMRITKDQFNSCFLI